MADITERLRDIPRANLNIGELAHEAADRLDEQEIAVGQAVAFAQYVEDHAKGGMVEAARKFLSLPFSQQIASRLKRAAELEAALFAAVSSMQEYRVKARAFRNYLVSEIADRTEGENREIRHATAESRINQFEAELDAAMAKDGA